MEFISKEEARKKIKQLVEHFEKNIISFKKTSFSEAQTENDFIRPLFSFLNWNVTNTSLEPEKQVFQLQVTGKTGDDTNKRPDYLIRVPDKDTNQMKSVFFIEAKKPNYDLKTNTKYIRQVYQYAYSTLNSSENSNNRVRLALLTDFEEFRFFDCLDPAPLKSDKYEVYNKHIVKDWNYKDYISKFDELWDMFEYNNVVNGSLEKWYLTQKQLADNRITPDKKFLEDLRTWRLSIAKSMHKSDKSLDDFRLTKSTLLLINRIIFVKMLADRDIEPDYLTDILSKLTKSKKEDVKLFELCRDIFDRLDHIYNGSMFAYDSDADEINIENSVLKNIFEQLKPEVSIYTLAAMPVEIIGNVYELFIAEQIAKKGTGLALLPKYDEKKAGGVYYTPRYIVEYIVDNTLGKKLEECKTPEDVSKIKVLDPARGSGSFLIVAYHKLLVWHKKWLYDELKKFTKQKKVSQFSDKYSKTARIIGSDHSVDYTIHLSHKLKSEILTNNIFGVDIDPQAVLVTKFSLSIKALEDSSHDEVIDDYNIFKMPTIPKLENNIKWGNSLIGSDFYIENQPDMFNRKEKRKINTFDWDGTDGFPDIINSGGFDVIIGNPPYVDYRSISKVQSDYLTQNYVSTKSKEKWSLFIPFLEKSAKLMNKKGKFGFIIPNNFLVSDFGLEIRKYLLNNVHINRIVDVSKFNVFGKVATYPVLFFFQKPMTESNMIEISYPKQFMDLGQIVFNQISGTDIKKGNRSYQLSTSVSNINLPLIYKMQLNSDKLVDLCDKFIWGTSITGFKNYKIDETNYITLNQKEKNKYNQVIQTADIKRFGIKWQQEYIKKEIYSDNAINEFNKDKIVIARVTKQIQATFDKEKYFLGKSSLLTGLKVHQNYLLGLLNSKLINYFYFVKYENTHMSGGYLRYDIPYLSKIPIHIIDFKSKSEKQKHDKLVGLVEQMLENQKYMHEAKTESDKKMYKNICDAIDKQIDGLVYKLYDLTPEEIAIVEGK